MQAILGNKLAPWLADRYLAQHRHQRPAGRRHAGRPDRPDNLFEPLPDKAATHGIFNDQAKPQPAAVGRHPPAGHRRGAEHGRRRGRRRAATLAMSEPSSPESARMPAPHVLREYALLADGERGILVGPRGDFVWMCFPRWDSDAVFSSLIGGAGAYAITPRDRCVWGGYYEPGTLIWRSRWITADAIIECREALAAPRPTRPRRHPAPRHRPARHGARARHPRPARRTSAATRSGSCSAPTTASWTMRSGDIQASWSGAAGRQPADQRGGLDLDLDLPEGAHHDLVLTLSARAAGAAAGPRAGAGPPPRRTGDGASRAGSRRPMPNGTRATRTPSWPA